MNGEATAGESWSCRACGWKLAMVEVRNGGRLELVFETPDLPSLIRNSHRFIRVECPECGEVRKWRKCQAVDIPQRS